MTEENKNPDVRLAEFSEDWKEFKIGEVFTEKKRPIELEDEKEYQLVTVKRRNEGVVSRGYLKGKDILVKNYSEVREGDFIISKRQVVHGATGIVPKGLDKAIVSNEYLVTSGNENISSEFWGLLSKLPKMKKKYFLSSYGVDIEKLVFDVEDWKNRAIRIPRLNEQDGIIEFFNLLDLQLTHLVQQYTKLINIKKSMLDKIFPSSGRDVPEIRFKAYKKKWKYNKLNEIGWTYTGLSGKTKEDFGHGNGSYVTYKNVFSNTISDTGMIESVEVDESQNNVKYGDVFFTTSSETPEEVGMSSVWLGKYENVYLNSFCFGFRPSVQIDSQYLAYVLRSPVFRQKVIYLAQGISRYNISKKKLVDLSIPIPEMGEQIIIGNFFKDLDSLIKLSQTQHLKLVKIKNAFMQKFFT